MTAKITQSGDITWADDTLFNGFLVLTMRKQVDGSANEWEGVAIADTVPPVRVPTRITIPIRQGRLDPDARVWRSDFLVPPGVIYSAFFYDSTGKYIAAGGDTINTFEVEAVTITVPQLSPPGLGSVVTP